MSKTVIITGGAGGIGSSIAVKFAKKGYNVAICYNNSKETALSICKMLNDAGFSAIAIQVNVADAGSVKRMVDEVKFNFGKVDVLINNAGIAQQKLFTDITDRDWQNMIGVNLTGVFNCCREVTPLMVSAKSGVIINISSMWGEVGASCEVHYSAAKAGVIGLTKSLAKELGPSNIRVNCITPGVIDTDMISEFSPDDIKALADETPLGRIGQPEDVASAALFLASDSASFITGQVLGVNGGFVI